MTLILFKVSGHNNWRVVLGDVRKINPHLVVTQKRVYDIGINGTITERKLGNH